jgi:hypothetical protein
VEAPAQSRYMTAGALSVALIAWLAIAQYLGAANVYFAATDNAVPTVLFGLLIPLVAAAVALWLSGNLASLVRSSANRHWSRQSRGRLIAARSSRIRAACAFCRTASQYRMQSE